MVGIFAAPLRILSSNNMTADIFLRGWKKFQANAPKIGSWYQVLGVLKISDEPSCPWDSPSPPRDSGADMIQQLLYLQLVMRLATNLVLPTVFHKKIVSYNYSALRFLYWPGLFNQDGWILGLFFLCMDLDSISIHESGSECSQCPAILTRCFCGQYTMCIPELKDTFQKKKPSKFFIE